MLTHHTPRQPHATTAPPHTFAGRFNPRSNSLGLLRLLLATVVAAVHASAIAYGHQPMLGATDLGSLAVDAFFVLSGFLVARSYLRLGSAGRYAWHRALRILPGFWLTLLTTVVVVAPLLARLDTTTDASHPAIPDGAWAYLTDNALLYIRDFSVAGLPTGTATPGVVNGALWTLFYEATCYALIAALGITGCLTGRRRLVVIALTITFGAALTAQEAGIALPGELFTRFFFVFLLGTLGQLYGHRIPITAPLTATALVVLAASLTLLHDYRPLGGAAFAYLCLAAVVATPWLRANPPLDLSYGMYVFHWPIEVLLVLTGATALTHAGYTALAITLTAALAAGSWTLVESPALKLKDLGKRTTPTN